MTMTRQQLWDKVNNENADLLFSLYHRWQDEKEFEDIQEYLKVIQKSIPEAYSITKRPFAIKCKTYNGVIEIAVRVEGRYIKLFPKTITNSL